MNHHTLLQHIRAGVVHGLVGLFLVLPPLQALPFAPSTASAATNSNTLVCPKQVITQDVSSQSKTANEGASEEDLSLAEDDSRKFQGIPDSNIVTFNDAAIAQSPYPDLFLKVLQAQGKRIEGGWKACSTILGFAGPLIITPTEFKSYSEALQVSESRITFKNPIDRYALTGEPCRKFIGTVCDTTTKEVPVYQTSPTTGETIVNASGNPIQRKDASGKPMTEKQPVYYDDIAWPNGHWDAPKADVRILHTLVYLVTPIAEGGAGREHIKVGRILQESKNEKEFTDKTDLEQSGLDAENLTVAAGSRGACGPPHFYDNTNPERPECVSQALDIDEIDNIRITTKIVKKRRITKSSTSWQFKTIPIKVAWQSDGIQKSGGLPPVNVYEGARQAFSGGLLELLQEYDFGIDGNASVEDITSLSDFAQLIGQSLFSQLLNSPSHSLSGWDLPSTLETLGRSYLAKEIGLVPGALADTSGDVVENIGRATLESKLGLPAGSLKGSTSDEIYTNLGRRYAESNLFHVSTGTLTNLPAHSTSDALLIRLGQGKIEEYFKLKAGSLQGVSSVKELKDKAGLKADLIFTKSTSSDVDEQLGLGFTEAKAGKDQFGYTAKDFASPTANFVSGSLKASEYFKLIGSRVIGGGVGSLAKGSGDSVVFNGVNPFNPADSTSIYRALIDNNETGLNQLISSGAFSNSTASSVRSRIETAKSRFTATSGNTVLQANYNEIAEPGTGWLAVFSKGLQLVQNSLQIKNTDTKTPSCVNKQSTDTNALAACATLQRSLNQLKAYQESILNYFKEQGSGQSAALNLSGTRLDFDNAGRLTSISVNTDPLTTLLTGNTSGSFATLGKQYLSHRLTPDVVSQFNLQSLLKTDLSPTFQTLAGLDIHEPNLAQYGLLSGDTQRIFQKGLGTEVFKRIGETELLRTVWNKSDLASSINKATQPLQTNTQDYTFYLTRFKQLQTLNSDLLTLVGQASELTTAQKEALRKQLSDRQNTPIPPTSGSVVAVSQQMQVEYKALQSTVNSQTGQQIISKSQQAVHIINEIIAGKPLGFNQAPNTSSGTSGTGTASGQCWSRLDIINLVKGQTTRLQDDLNGDGIPDSNVESGSSARQREMTDLAKKVAGCKLDDGLQLPAGSLLGWLRSNDYSYKSFTLAIGLADAKNQGNNLSSPGEAQIKGEQLLKLRAASLLPTLIPGFQNFAGKTGITSEDLVSILSGNSGAVLSKIGTSQIDQTMHWKMGTAGNLIQPTCYTNPEIGNPEKRPCTDTEKKNLRFSSMVQLGLQEIGVTFNFPATFDMSGSGGILTSYGRSVISESLNLKTNSFTGSFSNVRQNNTSNILLTGIGVSDTPYMSEAVRIQQLYTGRSDPKSQSIVASLSNYIQSARDYLLDDISNPNSLYWGESTAEAAAKLATRDKDAFFNVITALGADVRAKASNELTDIGLQTPTYQYRINDLHIRTNQLSKQYGGSFKDFITGKTTAESISGDTGEAQLKDKLKETAIKELADTLPDSMKSVVNGLLAPVQRLDGSTITNCPLYKFITTKSSDNGCDFGAVPFDIKNLLTSSDPKVQAARVSLFDNFLSRSFGTKLEDATNFTPGTIRSMVMDPAHADDIALNQGITMIADQLFSTQAGNKNYESQIKVSLHNAFLAAFEQPAACTTQDASLIKRFNADENRIDCFKYTLDFNKTRATSALRSSLTAERDAILAQEGTKSFGTPLYTSDLSRILHGDPGTLTFLAMQKFASSLNKQLTEKNDANASDFKIDYLDVRMATGTLTPDLLEAIGKQAAEEREAELRSYKPEDGEVYTEQEITSLSKDAYDEAVLATQQFGAQEAQKRLRYQVYDALAFKADSNIPLGFSQIMLEGTSSEKKYMIGAYAFNALNLGESLGGLSLDDVDTLYALSKNGFNDDNLCEKKGLTGSECGNFKANLTNSLLPKLESFIGDKLSVFGVDKLPPGTLLGFAAWAKTGFNSNAFNDSKLTFGGLTVPSLGVVMKDFAEIKLLSWADKTLGFDAGTSYKIYKAYSDYNKAHKAYKAAKNLNDIAGQAKYKASMREAEAAAITMIVTAVFGKQLAAVDDSLGLVPGTAEQLVGIGISYLLIPAFNPVIALGILLLTNLFGVYKVVITSRGTGDGYYPLNPPANKRPAEYLAPAADGTTGEFDTQKASDYHDGVKQAAQVKVHSVLRDLLQMPEKWGSVRGIDPLRLWISQVFSHPAGDLGGLNYLVSAPAPWDTPSGFGYGSFKSRTTGTVKKNAAGILTAKPVPGYNAGFFPDAAFWNMIHIRW